MRPRLRAADRTRLANRHGADSGQRFRRFPERDGPGPPQQEPGMPSRIVVTGIGVVSPNGFGVNDYWTATCGGKSGIGRITRFDPRQYPAKLAGEVSGFSAEEHLPSRLIPQTDRMTQL